MRFQGAELAARSVGITQHHKKRPEEGIFCVELNT